MSERAFERGWDSSPRSLSNLTNCVIRSFWLLGFNFCLFDKRASLNRPKFIIKFLISLEVRLLILSRKPRILEIKSLSPPFAARDGKIPLAYKLDRFPNPDECKSKFIKYGDKGMKALGVVPPGSETPAGVKTAEPLFKRVTFA